MLIWSLYFSMGRQTNKTKRLGKLEGYGLWRKIKQGRGARDTDVTWLGREPHWGGDSWATPAYMVGEKGPTWGEKGPILQMGEANSKENKQLLEPRGGSHSTLLCKTNLPSVKSHLLQMPSNLLYLLGEPPSCAQTCFWLHLPRWQKIIGEVEVNKKSWRRVYKLAYPLLREIYRHIIYILPPRISISRYLS